MDVVKDVVEFVCSVCGNVLHIESPPWWGQMTNAAMWGWRCIGDGVWWCKECAKGGGLPAAAAGLTALGTWVRNKGK